MPRKPRVDYVFDLHAKLQSVLLKWAEDAGSNGLAPKEAWEIAYEAAALLAEEPAS